MGCPCESEQNPQEESSGYQTHQSSSDIFFSPFDIKILGILLCSGDQGEKAIELYNICQNTHKSIGWTDKELQNAYFRILELSTEFMFNAESHFTSNPRPDALSDENMKVIKQKYPQAF